MISEYERECGKKKPNMPNEMIKIQIMQEFKLSEEQMNNTSIETYQLMVGKISTDNKIKEHQEKKEKMKQQSKS